MSDYNDRQYRRMLSLIEGYRDGQVSLHRLCNDVEALIAALEDVAKTDRDRLLSLWSPIDTADALLSTGELTEADLAKLMVDVKDIEQEIVNKLGDRLRDTED
jgi:hypothetical protein